jgi:hypothetical protein
MGHESRIEPWLPVDNHSACEFQIGLASLRKAMKTAARKNLNCWTWMARRHQKHPSSIMRGWKQEKLRPLGKCFFLTSPSIEHFHRRGGGDGCGYLSLTETFLQSYCKVTTEAQTRQNERPARIVGERRSVTTSELQETIP